MIATSAFADPVPGEASIDLTRLSFPEAVLLGRSIRRMCGDASRQQQVAQCIVEHMYDRLRDPATGGPACALVRCFQTHPFDRLPPDAQQAALRSLSQEHAPERLRCLALLGSRGDDPAWNQPETSVDHRAIPLPRVADVLVRR